MTQRTFSLQIPAHVVARIRAGEAWRDGGVVRDHQGRILAFLSDAPEAPPPTEWMAEMLGSMLEALTQQDADPRLDAIQQSLMALEKEIKAVAAGVQLLDVRADAVSFGKVAGIVRESRMRILAGRRGELLAPRLSLQEIYSSCHAMLLALARSPVLLKQFPDVAAVQLEQLRVVGDAIAWLSLEARELEGVAHLAQGRARDAAEVYAALQARITDDFSALFWRRDIHLSLVLTARSLSSTLLGDTAALGALLSPVNLPSFLQQPENRRTG